MEHDTETFKQWAERQVAGLVTISRRIIFEEKKEHAPMFFIYGPGDKALVIPIENFGTRDDKDRVAFLLRASAKVPGCRGSIFVTETWILSKNATPGDKDGLRKFFDEHDKKGIADHPDRREGLSFNCVRGTEQVLIMYPIDRAKGCFEEADIIVTADEFMSGRMIVNPEKGN